MGWAERRQFFIMLIAGAVIIAAIAVVLIATISKAPSCSDGIQNQGEQGIDCGGPCPYLCTATLEPPTVLYTQVFMNGTDRADAIASVENKNARAAAKAVPYTLSVYGTDQVLLQSVRGTFDLAPGATVPVYVPNIPTGGKTAASAFLVITEPGALAWQTMSVPPLPTVSGVKLIGTATAPRVVATLTNVDTLPRTNVRVVVLIHGAGDTVIAASSTVVPQVPPQGQATATFTWNTAFRSTPLSIEVVPIATLP